MAGLTAKQEKFVQGLVAGLSQRKAYSAAYDCRRYKPESIDQCAARLFATIKVRSRYDELIGELAERVLWDRARAAHELLEVREIALRHIRETAEHKVHYDEHNKRDLPDLPKTAASLVVSTTAELNKMFRVYDSDERDTVKVIDDV